MKKTLIALVCGVLSLTCKPVFADAIGSTVTGALYLGTSSVNSFSPGAGHVAAGAGNTTSVNLVVGTSTLFGYSTGGVLPGSVTALFNDNLLTVTTTAPVSLGSYELDFTDAAFTGINSSTETSLNALGFGNDQSSFAGDTLKVLVGAGVGLDVYSVNLACDPPAGPASVTPEPGSIALLGTGLLGFAGVMRRRVVA